MNNQNNTEMSWWKRNKKKVLIIGGVVVAVGIGGELFGIAGMFLAPFGMLISKWSALKASVDTSNILFIVGGAFVGLEKMISERSKETAIGFGATVKSKDETKLKGLIEKVETSDLIKFGLIPELVGRLPVVCTIDELNEDDLVKVLLEPKNSIVKQYKKLFELEGVELDFEEEALREIAKKAIERKTGARGLRSIVENLLAETMFEIPSNTNVKKVIITKETVLDNKEPTVILKNNK